MRKLRFYYWITSSFLKKHGKVIIPAAIIGAITFSQIPRLIQYIPQPKNTQYIGRVGSYTLSSLPKDIQTLVSSGLTEIDQSGQAQPSLAQKWEVIDQGQTYIFTLREGAQWQDGTPITAKDITYNINDVETQIQDENTVIFRLKDPFAPFPNIVSQPIFKRVKKSFLQIYDQTFIIGTGNYHIKRLQFKGNNIDQIVLESETEKRVYRFFNTEQEAITSYKLAEIDTIEDLSDPGELADWPNINIQQVSNHQRYVILFFNTQDPNLAEKKIRQALTYTIPNKSEPNIRANSPISQTSWAYNPNVKPYDYSLENAQTLLEGLRTDFDLELTTTPTYAQLAESIRDSWGQLGLNVSIKVVNLPDTNNFQALLIGQQLPPDPDQYLLWHSTQTKTTNITKYSSPKIDKLLEDGRKELEQQKRKEIYQDFQRFLVEDTPAAFLFYLSSYTISRPL